MNLFSLGEFRSRAGVALEFKIDCDALSNEDIECLAFVASKRLRPFRNIIPIPTGGNRLARALMKYCAEDEKLPTLIVDDVLTTGKSMRKAYSDCEADEIIGLVIFARGKCPDWVVPLFRMD